jgi:hypothetical protein
MLKAPMLLKRRSIHSGQLERWLGREKIEFLSNMMRHGGGPNVRWYGNPLPILDVPRDVSITGDGDFVGAFDRGQFASAMDHLAEHTRRLWRRAGRPIYVPEPVLNLGFSDFRDHGDKSNGFSYSQALPYYKSSPAVTTGLADLATLVTAPNVPVQESTPGIHTAATVRNKSQAGSFNQADARSGNTLHLLGADGVSGAATSALMVIDKLLEFDLGTGGLTSWPVTGTPTRYQSATPGDPDSAVGNFMFPVSVAVYAATTHSWSATYVDQNGNGSNSSPAVAGLNSNSASGIDLQNIWFMPLASGDSGVKSITTFACNVGVTTSTYVNLAHPLGVISFSAATKVLPNEWYRSKDLAPRVFDNAFLSLLSIGTTAAYLTYGNLYLVEGNA